MSRKQAIIDDLNEVISFLDYGDIEHADEKLGWMITEIAVMRDETETIEALRARLTLTEQALTAAQSVIEEFTKLNVIATDETKFVMSGKLSQFTAAREQLAEGAG